MNKILIIEDEIGVRITLEDRLTAEGYIVTTCDDGVSGQNEALKNCYDLILLDIMLPGIDGYKVCENIRKSNLLVPIIMLTARNTNLDVVIGLRQGADDYISKPFEMSVLIARIEAVLRRTKPNMQENFDSVSFGIFVFNHKTKMLLKNNEEVPLNFQEYKLLEYLIKNKNTVIDRNKILDDVWGYDNESSSRTLDVHIAKLRNKLEENHIPQYIQTIRGIGYKFEI